MSLPLMLGLEPFHTILVRNSAGITGDSVPPPQMCPPGQYPLAEG